MFVQLWSAAFQHFHFGDLYLCLQAKPSPNSSGNSCHPDLLATQCSAGLIQLTEAVERSPVLLSLSPKAQPLPSDSFAFCSLQNQWVGVPAFSGSLQGRGASFTGDPRGKLTNEYTVLNVLSDLQESLNRLLASPLFCTRTMPGTGRTVLGFSFLPGAVHSLVGKSA